MPLLDRQRDRVQPPVLLTASNVMTLAVKGGQLLFAVHPLLLHRGPHRHGGMIVASRAAERLRLSPEQILDVHGSRPLIAINPCPAQTSALPARPGSQT